MPLQSRLVKRDDGIGIDARTLVGYDVCHIMRIEKSALMLTWFPTAHGGLLQTSALPDPSIGRARVVSRMCAIGVIIVDIALFLTTEVLLYHLNEGPLLFCISLTRHLCGLLIGKANTIQKDPPYRKGIYATPKVSFRPFGYTLGIGIKMPLQLFAEQADLPTVKTPPIAIIQKAARFSSEVKILVPIDGSDVYTQTLGNQIRTIVKQLLRRFPFL